MNKDLNDYFYPFIYETYQFQDRWTMEHTAHGD